MTQVIDFSKLGGPVYVGRASGAQARKRLKIESLDTQNDPVVVVIPNETYAVNSSFFLGMFGPSLMRYDSRDAFLGHYRLQAPEHVLDALKLVIDRALASRGKLALTA